tara:strand:+ start:372 stop:491 length:120 start_codon:yes stop_codon:yes gene_type:complete
MVKGQTAQLALLVSKVEEQVVRWAVLVEGLQEESEDLQD